MTEELRLATLQLAISPGFGAISCKKLWLSTEKNIHRFIGNKLISKLLMVKNTKKEAMAISQQHSYVCFWKITIRICYAK